VKQFRPISIPFRSFDIIPECPGQTMINGIAISVSSVAEVTAGVELP